MDLVARGGLTSPGGAYSRLIELYGRDLSEVGCVLGGVVSFTLYASGDFWPPTRDRVLLPEDKRRLVVYVDEAVDPAVPSHVEFLKLARSLGGTLVVGIPDGASQARIESICACRLVSRAIVGPPELTPEFMRDRGLDLAVRGDCPLSRFAGAMATSSSTMYIPCGSARCPGASPPFPDLD